MLLKIHGYLNVSISILQMYKSASMLFLGKKELLEGVIAWGDLGHSFKY